MRSYTHLLIAPALFGWALLVPVVSAQEITGNIRGTITDSSGAVVPGATVILIDSGKALEIRRVTSNKSGEYVAPLLPVGTYEIDVESSGFKRASQKGVVVNVSDRLEENIALNVGDAGVTVDVTGSEIRCSCRMHPLKA